VLFKVVFLQFPYDLSDRQVEEQVNLHLAYKWFVGLQPEEVGPDHSPLCRLRARLSPEKFQEILNQIVQQAREVGLISDQLRIIPTPLQTPPAQTPNTPDPDARFGRKSQKKSFYGYKRHLATDAGSKIITAARVTPGNVPDSHEFVTLVDPCAREVTADKGYDTNANHQKLKRRGQCSSIILKNNRTAPQVLDPASSTNLPNRGGITDLARCATGDWRR